MGVGLLNGHLLVVVLSGGGGVELFEGALRTGSTTIIATKPKRASYLCAVFPPF